jgi:hypothetical protein
MSRTLKRPMFRRGGYADTGIMDGFSNGGGVRRGSQADPKVVQQMADLINAPREEASLETTEPVFTPRQAPDEPIMGLSDYASLFKLGAGIASAPGRGSGLSGLLASAGPSLEIAADEFAASQEAKALRKREFEQSEQARKDAFEAEQREFGRQDLLLDKEYKLKTALAETEADLDIADITLRLEQAAPLKEQLAELITTKDEIMNTGTPAEKRSILTRIRAKQNEIAGVMGQAIDVGDIDDSKARAIRKDAENNALNDLGLETEPVAGDPNFAEYEQLKKDYEQYFTVEYLLLVTEGAEFAKGGRVGMQQGGQAGDTGPMLTFEELRARLPMEVTDQVVRLIASSEAALLDFANIDTQEDIAIFNQKYNVDLQLPTQAV